MRNFSRLFTGAPLLLLWSMIACGPKPVASSNGPDGGSGPDASAPFVDASAPLEFDAANLTLITGTVGRADPTTLPPSALTDAVAANNAFALALYPLASAGTPGNFLTSPVSASLALTMAYAVAANQTATEMATALHLGSTPGSIFDGQNALSAALNGRAATALASETATATASSEPAPSADNYALDVVNSIWGAKGDKWAPDFLNVLSGSYGTGVYEADFAGDASGATATINDWVSAKTSGKIYPLFSKPLGRSSQLVLVNAVHVKLPWMGAPFVSPAAKTAPFTRADGSSVAATVIYGQIDALAFGYTETKDATYAALALAGGQLKVVFALPTSDVPSLLSSLTPASWASAWAGLSGTQDAVLSMELPKFAFTTPTFSLKGSLEKLGMVQAFGPQADFSNLSPKSGGPPLRIDDVVQRATIEVSELGVEASAASAITHFPHSSNDAPPLLSLLLDRPFLFSIVDATGAILLLGQVNDPTESSTP